MYFFWVCWPRLFVPGSLKKNKNSVKHDAVFGDGIRY